MAENLGIAEQLGDVAARHLVEDQLGVVPVREVRIGAELAQKLRLAGLGGVVEDDAFLADIVVFPDVVRHAALAGRHDVDRGCLAGVGRGDGGLVGFGGVGIGLKLRRLRMPACCQNCKRSYRRQKRQPKRFRKAPGFSHYYHQFLVSVILGAFGQSASSSRSSAALSPARYQFRGCPACTPGLCSAGVNWADGGSCLQLAPSRGGSALNLIPAAVLEPVQSHSMAYACPSCIARKARAPISGWREIFLATSSPQQAMFSNLTVEGSNWQLCT